MTSASRWGRSPRVSRYKQSAKSVWSVHGQDRTVREYQPAAEANVDPRKVEGTIDGTVQARRAVAVLQARRFRRCELGQCGMIVLVFGRLEFGRLLLP